MNPEEIFEVGQKWRYTITLQPYTMICGDIKRVIPQYVTTFIIEILTIGKYGFEYSWEPNTSNWNGYPEPRELDEQRPGYLRYRKFYYTETSEYRGNAICELEQLKEN